jgi:hypothetical protein
MDEAEPKRQKLRVEEEDPILRMSIILIEEPRRPIPNTEMLDPSRAKDLKE